MFSPRFFEIDLCFTSPEKRCMAKVIQLLWTDFRIYSILQAWSKRAKFFPQKFYLNWFSHVHSPTTEAIVCTTFVLLNLSYSSLKIISSHNLIDFPIPLYVLLAKKWVYLGVIQQQLDQVLPIFDLLKSSPTLTN